MVGRTAQDWVNYAEALAFCGNSLLAPMNQTETAGLLPGFWDEFPSFADADVAAALAKCKAYAKSAAVFADEGGNAVQRVSVEYTKLFVGPPRPAAAPWETMYCGENVTVGFGEPTFAMQRLLREAKLEVSNENNQYADHIGIELLYASVLCTRAAEGQDDGTRIQAAAQIAAYVQDRPLRWIDKLISAVDDCEPSGYISAILALAKALLTSLKA